MMRTDITVEEARKLILDFFKDFEYQILQTISDFCISEETEENVPHILTVQIITNKRYKSIECVTSTSISNDPLLYSTKKNKDALN
jgi:hypothetical protein